MKKILITGGSGYLGIRLAINLKNKYKIYLGSRNNHLNRKAQDLTKCEIFPLDITNINSIKDREFTKPKSQIVSLELVSEQYMSSIHSKVSKSYRDKTISQIVKQKAILAKKRL